MRIQGFHHLAIQVQNLEACAAFYQSVLGLNELKRHARDDGSLRSIWMEVPEGGFIALESAGGSLEATPFRTAKPGLLLFALRIGRSEKAAWVDRLEALDVKIEHQTRWTLYLRDPEGNRVALSHHPDD